MVRGSLAKNFKKKQCFTTRAYKKTKLSEGPELLEVFGLEIFENSNSNSNINGYSNRNSSVYTKIGSKTTF